MERPPAPPRRRMHLPAALRAALLPGAALALAVAPGAARADEDGRLDVDSLRVERGIVVADVRLVDAFDPDTRRSIERGLPITVTWRVEMWRDRRHWFDKQIDARVEAFRVHWDPGQRRFVVTWPGPRERRDAWESLDDLLAELSERSVALHPRWDLEPENRYFALLEVAIQPITLAEFRELDGWIRGRLTGSGPDPEDGSDPDRAEDDDGGVTEAVFGFLVDLSGFGDTIHRARTPRFRPADLPIAPTG